MGTNKISDRLIDSLSLPFKMVATLWGIQVFQWLLGLKLGFLGVFPQKIFGLKGILFSPLIHGDFGHLLSNTPPLFVLSALILFFYKKVAIRSFAMIYFLTGLAVWLFGRPVFHIGASGVIYGLVAFVFWSGIFRRNFKSIALALLVVFYYGSMVLGVLPGQEGISWESHLLGGLVGIFVAWWYKETIEKDEERETYSWEAEPELPPRPFFEHDLFEKTKAEREKEQQAQNRTDWF
ncbi:MAG: rhomboid family intramembrane serine protease [Saprospiraceae bacterium]